MERRKTAEQSGSESHEHEHTAKTTRESEHLLSEIVDFLPDAAFVINTEHKVVAWNRAMEEVSGIEAARMLGKGDFEYALPAYGKRRPLLIDLVLQPEADVEKEYSSLQRDKDALIAQARIPFCGERMHLWCKAGPIHDADGRVIGAIECIRNVAETREHVREIYKREALFRTLAENDPMGISLMRSDLTFEYMNPRFTEMFGYTIEDLPDKLQWFQCAFPDQARRQEALTQWKEKLVLESPTGVVVETTVAVCCKDGSEKLVNIRSVVMQDGRHLQIYQDVTQHREHEALLRQSQKLQAIGTLAGGIAHDFNNILSPIIGYTELALNELPAESRLARNLGQVLKSAHRAKDLVKQILAFNRQSEQELIPIHALPIVKEACHLLRASLPSTIDLRLKFAPEASFSTILADPTQIHQVLMNLCTNSNHAMREKGGVLEVSLCNVELGPEFVSRYMKVEPGPYLRLTVSDTGPGMSPEIQHRIFEPYFTTKRHGEGTGMGLATVFGIVQNHNGTVTVSSSPGQGSTFNVFFPKVVRAVKTPEVKPVIPSRGMGYILFVDDEEPLREMAKHFLGEFGYSVVVKKDGQEALDAFRALPDIFDVVVTDYTMPRMTGTALAEEILQVRPGMPIVLCTGYSDAVDEKTAAGLGIREFLMKPVSFLRLAELLLKLSDPKRLPAGIAVGKG